MMLGQNGTHLSYCTNIHPGESLDDVVANLERHVTRVKDRLAPEVPFGIGLRLSARAARELAEPGRLEGFKSLLDDNGLYVFTLNGFPHGDFHGTGVKADVYRPDWREAERLRYTNQLADLLAEILPDDPALQGTISTVPGAFEPALRSPDDAGRIAGAMIDAVAHLVAIKERTGRSLALAIEPEPCCLLETVEETVAFFQDHLFSASAAAQLGLSRAAAEEVLHEHLGVCLDLCHAAVEYEDPATAVSRLRRAGIAIAKVQISAGLRLAPVGPDAAPLLSEFDDGVYLHQVVERRGDGLVRYTDLDAAFAALGDGTAQEWRVHFHVPVFVEDLGGLRTTKGFIREILDLHREDPISKHFEVETYTWGVLPGSLRLDDVVDDVARELNWVLECLEP